MKLKGLTFIEIITVLAIVVLLASLSILAVKTVTDSYRIPASLSVINSFLNLARSNARKEGSYAGVYFHDQNDVLCTMEVIDLHDYNVPYIRLGRLIGTEITEIGAAKDMNEAVVLFSQSGRLVYKDIEIKTYRDFSSRTLNIGGKSYIINPNTGQLIVP